MSTSEVPYVVITVECQHCKTKQTVHVDARVGTEMVGNQTIPCISCGRYFVVMAPNRIVAGPFPKR
jgi:uncharacterized protein YifN (PemK superfamily)